MIYYHVLEYQKENVFHQIIVLVTQDIIHLIVHYIIVMENFIMIQLFVQEMEIAFQVKFALVKKNGLMKIVKLKLVIQFLQIYQQFVMEMEIVFQLIIVLVIMVILENFAI
jgi:hypothetical protein